jgi:uncharacterized protein YpuA (DUF1002 family)
MGRDEVKKMIKNWFNGLAVNFYDEDIQKLITCYNKCQNLHGDYVDK